MTTQLLSRNPALEPALETERSEAVSSNSQATTSVETSALPPSISPSLPDVSKLPYQKPQQIELLKLRAKTDALLQQLQGLKQQKLSTSLEETAPQSQGISSVVPV